MIFLKIFSASFISLKIDEEEHWERAGEAAISCLETSAAAKFYRHIQQAGMVMSLLDLGREEDTALLTGNCFMLLGQFDRAQEHFLKSSNPLAALEMRRDLQLGCPARFFFRKFFRLIDDIEEKFFKIC